DQLGQNWPKLYTLEQSAEKPSEEFFKLSEGDDYGWPHCYHDAELGHLVLAPEYGGDGKTVGRCKDKKEPLVAFPAHWAPNGVAVGPDGSLYITDDAAGRIWRVMYRGR